jgi:hypothetical protein
MLSILGDRCWKDGPSLGNQPFTPALYLSMTWLLDY